MKSISLRSFFVTCLCIASFCSFIFLNLGITPDLISSQAATENVYEMEADSSETTILLPDLEMLEKVIEKGKSHLRLISRF